jgi:hypothetical protein
MTKFETNKTYTTRSICNNECIISAHIAKRTAKTVTLSNDNRTDLDARGKTFRIRPCVWGEAEVFSPWGRYSMSPTISAS